MTCPVCKTEPFDKGRPGGVCQKCYLQMMWKAKLDAATESVAKDIFARLISFTSDEVGPEAAKLAWDAALVFREEMARRIAGP